MSGATIARILKSTLRKSVGVPEWETHPSDRFRPIDRAQLPQGPVRPIRVLSAPLRDPDRISSGEAMMLAKYYHFIKLAGDDSRERLSLPRSPCHHMTRGLRRNTMDKVSDSYGHKGTQSRSVLAKDACSDEADQDGAGGGEDGARESTGVMLHDHGQRRRKLSGSSWSSSTPRAIFLDEDSWLGSGAVKPPEVRNDHTGDVEGQFRLCPS